MQKVALTASNRSGVKDFRKGVSACQGRSLKLIMCVPIMMHRIIWISLISLLSCKKAIKWQFVSRSQIPHPPNTGPHSGRSSKDQQACPDHPASMTGDGKAAQGPSPLTIPRIPPLWSTGEQTSGPMTYRQGRRCGRINLPANQNVITE